MTYEIVAKVPPGGSYVAVAQKQDWYKIQLPDGRAGWIHLHDTVQEKPRSQTATPPALLSHTAPPAASAMPSKLSHPQPPATRSRRAPPAYGTSHGLVIGNAAYAESPLQNAVKDAVDITALLRRLSFEVTFLQDVPLQGMQEAVHAFNLRLRQGRIGLFYFAGHGIQMDGKTT